MTDQHSATETTGWYSSESATFGDRLAAAREAAGMSQSLLAKRLGVKLSTVRGWEDDLTEPRANKLQMVSGVLGVSLPWLLTGIGNDVAPPGEAGDLPGDIASILGEIRDLRVDLTVKADRLAVLEKQLRGKLKEDV
ncbi:helix-turn-helix domain-containing protein [Pseudooceanicola sp. C21-150M6]|uniref:helix-turn-helix domain-containing protein n=1 Tax=Pseudooceanicola sp. C21-150M6 TaxID=3434355 RepID=UPI003D7F66DF